MNETIQIRTFVCLFVACQVTIPSIETVMLAEDNVDSIHMTVYGNERVLAIQYIII